MTSFDLSTSNGSWIFFSIRYCCLEPPAKLYSNIKHILCGTNKQCEWDFHVPKFSYETKIKNVLNILRKKNKTKKQQIRMKATKTTMLNKFIKMYTNK